MRLPDSARALLARYMTDSRNLHVDIGLLAGGRKTVYGFVDGRPAPDAAPRIFEIGSITKTVTGSLLCKLLAQGQLTLDERVSDYYEGLDDAFFYPTVLQLATHTAGYDTSLPYSDEQRARLDVYDKVDLLRVNPFRRLTTADIAVFVRQAKLTRQSYPPEYSNLGIAILGDMMAKAAGRPIVPLLRDFIEQDLGLAGFCTDRPQTGYVEGADADGTLCGNWLWDCGPFTCVGGLYTTADKLLDYAARHIANTPAYLAAGHRPHAACFEPDGQTGLCWLIDPREEILWHNGGTGCFKTYLGLIPRSGAAVAVLSNQKARNGVMPEQIGVEILKQIR